MPLVRPVEHGQKQAPSPNMFDTHGIEEVFQSRKIQVLIRRSQGYLLRPDTRALDDKSEDASAAKT